MTLSLGIETSCDETAVAIVSSEKEILHNAVFSQIKEHEDFGGVVPELAARAHIKLLPKMINDALEVVPLSEIDLISVTAGPGLIGGIIVGLMMAKAMAAAASKPIIGVNHLEGHALTPMLVSDVSPPYLLLLISGGHSQIIIVEGIGKYHVLGGTIDDSLGEAFDKTARMLNLGYPGGPEIEKSALNGRPIYDLPKPLCNKQNCDFSFSGLKTAVLRLVERLEHDKSSTQDVCASFQNTVADILCNRLRNAFNTPAVQKYNITHLVISGGVAANRYLYRKLTDFAKHHKYNCIAPPITLCTDNAAMIAWTGICRFSAGLEKKINILPKSSWHLDKF